MGGQRVDWRSTVTALVAMALLAACGDDANADRRAEEEPDVGGDPMATSGSPAPTQGSEVLAAPSTGDEPAPQEAVPRIRDDDPLFAPLPPLRPDADNDIPDDEESDYLEFIAEVLHTEAQLFATGESDPDLLQRTHVDQAYDKVVARAAVLAEDGVIERLPDCATRASRYVPASGRCTASSRPVWRPARAAACMTRPLARWWRRWGRRCSAENGWCNGSPRRLLTSRDPSSSTCRTGRLSTATHDVSRNGTAARTASGSHPLLTRCGQRHAPRSRRAVAASSSGSRPGDRGSSGYSGESAQQPSARSDRSGRGVVTHARRWRSAPPLRGLQRPTQDVDVVAVSTDSQPPKPQLFLPRELVDAAPGRGSQRWISMTTG